VKTALNGAVMEMTLKIAMAVMMALTTTTSDVRELKHHLGDEAGYDHFQNLRSF